MKIHFKKSLGFTLVELAIVIVIVGLLLSAFLIPLSAQQELRDRAETQNLLDQAKEALIGYALVNRYLPCPDTKAIPDGVENRKIDGSCLSDKGILPWNTLGIDRVDAWSHYFYYRVDTTFSNSVTLFTVNDAEMASGIEINSDVGSLVSASSRPAALVLSYGSNGNGAKNTTQETPANQLPAPTGVDEKENTDGNLVFMSHTPTPRGSANEFDDMLIWISPKILINRMIQAERIP